MWLKIIMNLVTLGIPAIIQAASRARRKKREQEARLKRERARWQRGQPKKAAKK
jgi:hypothetical protein